MRKLRINYNEQGFTLIELMIVIAIIGILAAIAIPNFIAYRNKAFCSGTEADANSIAASISDYFSVPSNVSITIGTYNASATTFKPKVNTTYGLIATDPNVAITISVADDSGRCPADYVTGQAIANGTGWTETGAGAARIPVYHKVIAQ